MFLHAGASLHGHEFSAKRPLSGPLPPAKKGSLLKTALRPLTAPSDASKTQLSRQLPDASRRSSIEEEHRQASRPSGRRTVSSGSSRKEAAVRFREPGMLSIHTPSASEDEESLAGSEVTDATCDTVSRRPKRRRTPRKSTRYAMALPAPQLRTKQRHLIQIRPRLLLQLQEIGDRRAIPAFDLIPSHLVAGRFLISKLSKRFPRIFHANAELGQNDILLVRSDDYETSPPTAPSVNTNDEKTIMAVISAAPGGCTFPAEIAFEDGSCWSASPMANGSYEFTNNSAGGSTRIARWVRRSNMSNRNSGASFEPPSSARLSTLEPSQDARWTFSLMDPSSRRHPVLGSLTQDTLEVYDSYTTLSTSSGRYPPSRDPFSGSGPEHRETLAVAREEKDLMIATASWIRLYQQGWPASASPKFARAAGPPVRSASTSTCSTTRRQTFPFCEGDNSCATSPLNLFHCPDSMFHSPSPQSRRSGLPARAMSTGRAFMKRRSSRMEGLTSLQKHGAEMVPHREEKLGAHDADKTSCLVRVRQWTSKLLQKKKEVVR